ncbi:MAG: Na+/H+ antiporter subunit E [Proteobacteria bacterium]|jgi:multicomponent Na+:H+ antiporter subunit E|nr:Na+/H+ antiporter subunit E [Pseudomonadota bacterium]MBT5227384.1 Na+/H+ antiporter subunit E [Pseudomonadota bacterium]MBT5819543.1 Na+/H+ antiporter subunit E [Pseudomonadota bacterium]MBT6347636.1 Na+/H+ antiporter subunit E [Pseudomonadota bacterium]
MRKTITLLFILSGTWLLLSGHTSPLLLSLGLLSVTAVVACVSRLEVLDDEGVPVHLLPGLIRYVPWLIGQVIRSNLDVARRIVSPELPIHPSVVKVDATHHTEVGRVTYANSITLTPGTISLDVSAETIEVHALTEDAANDLMSGEMARRVQRAEGA